MPKRSMLVRLDSHCVSLVHSAVPFYLYVLLIEVVRRRVYVKSLKFHSLVTFLIL